jgi:hypothetical protein
VTSNGETNTSPARVLSAVTGVAALAVGFLYSVGAVLIAGQLRTTEIATRDVLPVVPLPQMLGRGMSVLLGSFGLAVALVFLAAVGIFLGQRHESTWRRVVGHIKEVHEELDSIREDALRDNEEQRQKVLADVDALRKRIPPAPSRGLTGGLRRGFIAFQVVVGLALVFVAPPAATAFIVVAVGLIFLLILGSPIPVYLAAGGSWLALWGGLLMTSFYYPQPLAAVTLTTTGGAEHTGRLIVQSGDTLYVSERPKQMTLFPVAQLQSASVTSEKRKKPRGVYRILWDGIERVVP